MATTEELTQIVVERIDVLPEKEQVDGATILRLSENVATLEVPAVSKITGVKCYGILEERQCSVISLVNNTRFSGTTLNKLYKVRQTTSSANSTPNNHNSPRDQPIKTSHRGAGAA